jgi:aryl-alcohol dehydrogenase-like predicted oxidoreductase
MTIPRKVLGGALEVSAIGLGCMGMSNTYGTVDPEQSIATIRRALDLGIDFIDTADIYGLGGNETLVGRAIAHHRDEAVLATKFGIVALEDGRRGVDGSPDHARRCCEESLRRLDVDVIDLYYLHRVDPTVPIEDTVGAMSDLVREGKVRYLGLSMATAETLQRAETVHPISALQSEWSLWSRDIESEVVPAARALGVGIVPFSPLGRGFLTGSLRDRDALEPNDARRRSPRFQGGAFERHAAVVAELGQLAADRGITVAQLSLAWVLGQGNDVVPIPGSSRIAHLESNAVAANIALETDECERISAVVPAEMTSDAAFAVPGLPRGGDSPPLPDGRDPAGVPSAP